MAKEYVAGVSMADGRAQLAVFELRDRETSLLYIEEYERNDQSPLWFLRGILEPHAKVVKKVTRVSIAIDYSSVLLHAFPMDTSLTQSEQNQHVHWELGNIIPQFQAKDHICDVHILKTRARDQIADVLVVAVQRSLVFEIQRAIAEGKMEIGIVDTGYFATEHALLINYPEVKIKTVALVVVENQRIDLGWEYNGRLVRYETTRDRTPDEVIHKIRNQFSEFPVTDIYLSGSHLSNEFLIALQEGLGLPVTAVDPFFRMIDTRSCRGLEAYEGSEYRLAACAGIALRKR